MSDIPLISVTPGSATNAPNAATNTINPTTVLVNTFNDVTIPALQASTAANSAAISTLQSEIGVAQKISALLAGGILQSSDLIPIERGGNNFSVLGSAFGGGVGGSGHVLDFSTVAGYNNTGLVGISAAFQTALAAALAANQALVIPPGLYLVDTPIDLGVNVGDGPTIIGLGSPAVAYSSNVFALSHAGSDVIFYSTSVNTPCFYNSQKLRGLYMSNLQILGTNIFTTFQAPNDFPQNYNLGQAFRTSPFSPHCGIAIDAFNIAVPSDGGYPGMTAKYQGASNGSSGIYLDNVCINGFVVCFGLCLSGNGNQSDTVYLRNCTLSMFDTGIATGSQQAKAAYFIGGGIGNGRQAFDGANYGVATPGTSQGFPWGVLETNFGYLHRIVNYNAVGPLILLPNYIESVRSIGNFGSSGSTARAHCTISLGPFTQDNATSLPPVVVFDTYGACSIRDTNFQGAASAGNAIYAWNFGNDITLPIKLDTCTFSSSVPPTNPAFVGVQVTTTAQGSAVQLDNCLMNAGFPAMPFSDTSVADVSAFTLNGRFMGSVRSGRYGNGTGIVDYISPNAAGMVSVAATATTLVSRSVTFANLAINAVQGTLTSGAWGDKSGWYMTTFPNADVRPANYTNGSTTVKWGGWGVSSAMTTPAATAANVALTFTATDPLLVQVGDILTWYILKQYSGSTKRAYPCWIVTANAAGACTAQPIVDATQFDTVANNFGGSTLLLLQKQWAPSGGALTCTTDGTTAVITAVSPITVLSNGDWVTGTGIPANTRVVSGGGTATVTLSRNTTSAAAGTALHFGTLQQPTLTTVW